MSAPLSSYVQPGEIRARLETLRDKCERVAAYNHSCATGTPDVTLLDEKQQALLDFRQRVRAQRGHPPHTRFPYHYRRTLGWTIHTLETRLARIRREEAEGDAVALGIVESWST